MTQIRLYGPADFNHTSNSICFLITSFQTLPAQQPPTSSQPTVNRLVSQLGQLALDLVVNLGGLLGLGELSSDGLLALVVCRTLNLASLLESVIDVS